MRARVNSLFGESYFFSTNLMELGNEASLIYANNHYMQKAWAREHGVDFRPEKQWRFRLRRGVVPWLKSLRCDGWIEDIVAAQIKHYKPDVLINFAMDSIPGSSLFAVKEQGGLLVGWGEPPALLAKRNWRDYDLVLAPSEGVVDIFRSMGVKADLLRYAFEPRVSSETPQELVKPVPVSFVGSIWKTHAARSQLLEMLCTKLGQDMFIWSPGIDDSTPVSIRQRYQGASWGADVFKKLSASKVTVNCHIDIAGSFADNMRLFEATGVGCMLITDWKENLHRIFEIGKEVVAYRTPEECTELIQYYLTHDQERQVIARAGQERTLRDHTYYQRMQELLGVVQRHL